VFTPGGTWRNAGRLPRARAYSATVSTADGVLVMGGEDADTLFQDSLLLRWEGGKVTVSRGPALPAARTSLVAIMHEGNVYVAGGFGPGAVRQSTRDFWRLDLQRRDEGWKSLASWPGPARAQAVMAALGDGLYLVSGLEMMVDAQGKPKPTYLTDAYRYRGDAWERLPDPPWSAIAAPSPAPVTTQPARLFVIGGVDGRRVGKVPRDTRVPDQMMYFDVAGHAWRTMEERWPDPVVTAPSVWFDGAWWIVSGEIMAGVRTVSVWSWKP
jgi:N-acetylneuraminic acid mutarotase